MQVNKAEVNLDVAANEDLGVVEVSGSNAQDHAGVAESNRIEPATMSAKELVGTYCAAWEDIRTLSGEILAWVPEELMRVRNYPDVVERVSALYKDAVRIIESALLASQAVDAEIRRRLFKNKVNYHFGVLLIGHKGNDMRLQKKAYGKLKGIMLGKIHNEGLYRKDNHSWVEPMDEALAEQCKKFGKDSPMDIFFAIMEDRFGHIYKAIHDKMIDDLRRAIRRAREVPYGAAEFFDRLPAATQNPDFEIQLKEIKPLLLPHGGKVPKSIARVLAAIRAWLDRVDELGGMSEAELAAWLVKQISSTARVSLTQARNDIRKFRAQYGQGLDVILRARREIGALVPREEQIDIGSHELQDESSE